MLRVLKYAGVALAALIGLVVFAVVVLSFIPDDKYRDYMTAQVEAATGRSLQIAGEFNVRVFPAVTVVAGDVRFANAEWGSRDAMFTARRLEATLALAPLLQGIVEVAVRAEEPDLLLETDADGRGNWQMGKSTRSEPQQPAAPSDDGFALRVVPDVRIGGLRAAFLDGVSGERRQLDVAVLELGGPGEEMAVVLEGSYEGTAFALSGSLGRTADLLANRATPVRLDGRLDEATLEVRGEAGPFAPVPMAELDVALRSDSVAAMARLAGKELPELGALSVAARLTAAEGRYAVSGIELGLAGETTRADVSGEIADAVNVAGLSLSVSAQTEVLAELVEALGVEVPVALPPSVSVSGEVSGGLEALGLADLEVQVRDEGVEATVTGTAEDVLSQRGLALALEMKAASVAELSRYAGREIPALGPLSVSARVVSEGEVLAVRDVRAELAGEQATARVTGALADVLAVKGLEAEVAVQLGSLSVLDALVAGELPRTGPLSLAGRVSAAEGMEGGAEVSAKLEGEGLSATLDGALADFRSLDGIELVVGAEAPSLALVGALAQQELPDRGPVKLSATLRTEPGSYRLDGLQLNVAEDEVRGDAAFLGPTAERGRPKLTARLESQRLDFGILLPAPVDESTKQAQAEQVEEAVAQASEQGAQGEAQPQAEAEAEAEAERVFPAEPLPLEQLRAVDADIALRIGRAILGKTELADLEAALTLDNGVLTLEPLNARASPGGSVEGLVRVDSSGDTSTLLADIDIGRVAMPRLGGTLDVEVRVNGSGNSVAALMGGLNGQVLVRAVDGRIERSFLTGFGTGLLDSINPLAKDEEFTTLECLVARLDVVDGKIELQDKIAAQTNKVTWFVAGDIDLKTEKIDIGASPKPRKGVGLSAGGLAKLVHVGGTLKKPRVRLDPKDVAKKYAGYLAAVQTGGLSLLVQGFLDKRKANVDVCQEVLKDTQFD